MSNEESFEMILASLLDIDHMYSAMVQFAGARVASAKLVEFLQRIQVLIRRGNQQFNLFALEMIHDIILNNVVHGFHRQTNGAHVVRNRDNGNTGL